MISERWIQICEILDAALELAPEEVSGFIDERCAGDDEMKTEVKSLYASLRKRDTAFDIPAPEIIAQDIAQRSQQPMLEVGQCLEGRYEICEQLGEGGFAQVYKAKDKKLDDRYVAIKIFSPSPENRSDEALRRFRDEARAVSNLGHPNIVTVHDVGKHDIEEEGDTPFIVTEFIDGITLRQRMKQSQIKLSEALDIAIQLTSALIPVHANEIVHRDIKPENIMLGNNGLIKIFDFGVAKFTRKEILASESQGRVDTKSGATIGSNKYMSPEQLQGMRDIDGRSDIWAVGVVLYEMIAGRVPFHGLTPHVVSHLTLSDEKPEPLSKYSSEVTPELSRLVSKALSKDREKRYESAKAMFFDLQQLKISLERDEAKQNLKTIFLNFISRTLRGLRNFFSSINSARSPVNQKVGGLFENTPTGEDSEETQIVGEVRDAPARTPLATAALRWGKAHRQLLIMFGIALLLLLISKAIFFYLGGSEEPPRNTNATNENNRNAKRNTNEPDNNSSRQGSGNTGTSNDSNNGSSNGKIKNGNLYDHIPPRARVDRLVWKRNLRADRGVAWAVALSPDSKVAASGGRGNHVRLWETDSWRSELLPSPLEGRDNRENIVTSIAFSHDSEMIASSSKDKTILLWNKKDQYAQPKELIGHSDEVNVVTFSPTEQLLASGGKDRNVILWELQTGRQYRLPHNGEILAIAFSPDGNTLASADKEGTIRIWDLQRVKDRSLLTSLRGGEFQVLCAGCGEIYALAFTCDGKILVSGGSDEKIRRWDWQTKKELEPIGKHETFVTSLAFSPNCTSLASSSGDGTVRLWNLETGKNQILKNHRKRVNWISFSGNGMLISGSHDGTVKIWQLTGE